MIKNNINIFYYIFTIFLKKNINKKEKKDYLWLFNMEKRILVIHSRKKGNLYL